MVLVRHTTLLAGHLALGHTPSFPAPTGPTGTGIPILLIIDYHQSHHETRDWSRRRSTHAQVLPPRHSTDSSHADARPMTEAKTWERERKPRIANRVADPRRRCVLLASIPIHTRILCPLALPEMQIFRDFSTDFSPKLAPPPTYASDSDVPPPSPIQPPPSARTITPVIHAAPCLVNNQHARSFR